MHEGWQLELIISSILLVVLSGTDEIFNDWMVHLVGPSNGGGPIWIIFIMIVLLLSFAVEVAKLNLIIYIFLRGLWVGCIGLRNISAEINLTSLDYTPKFNNFLAKKIGNFDNYLERLEKNCSTIFSFTFLIIFEVFSIFMVLICMMGIMGSTSFILELIFTKDNELVKNIFQGIAFFLLGIFLLSALLHLIDFIFIGFFKKKKLLAKVYYPFYRFYNFFSFSFLYRPVYYNFIDNKYGRNYVKLIIPYLIVLMLLSEGINIGEFKYLPPAETRNGWLQPGYYDDSQMSEEERIGYWVSLPSMHVKESFLPVFLRYSSEGFTNKVLSQLCPDFTEYESPEVRLRILEAMGFYKNEENIGVDNISEQNGLHNLKADTALTCVAQLYDLQIDSVRFDNPDYFFHRHPDLKWRGILTYLDVDTFSRGKHILRVTRKRFYRDSAFVRQTYEIPFIKY